MKLSRNRGISIAIAITVFALYNLVVFHLPIEHTIGFWTGYIFLAFATLNFVTAVLLLLNEKNDITQMVKFSLLSIAWVYFITQLILSILQMTVIFPYILGLETEFMVAGYFFTIVLLSYRRIKTAESRVEATQKKVLCMKELQTDLELLQANNAEVKNEINSIIDTVRFCDPMSHSQLNNIDEEILLKVEELMTDISDTDKAKALCRDIEQLLIQRSAKCKLLKNVRDVQKHIGSRIRMRFVVIIFGVVGMVATIALVFATLSVPINR